MSPDELRSALAVAFPAEPPPPDLAGRAERTAGRIRRRRVAAVAAAAAVAVAVPLSVAALRGPDRALPPGTSNPSDPACVWEQRVLARQGAATREADILAWGVRGDAGLRGRMTTVARAAAKEDVRVLYAGPFDGMTVVVYVARASGPPGARVDDWGLTVALVDAEDRMVTAQAGQVALLGPAAATSVLLRRPDPSDRPRLLEDGSPAATNLLVVLAPPGSAGVTFRGCRDGKPFTVEGKGDTLVRDVGTLDAPGRLAVRTATGGVGYQGPVEDLPWIPGQRPTVELPPVEPFPAPPGTRRVVSQVSQGSTADLRDVGVDRGSVFIRCRAPAADGPTEVYAGTRLLGAATCDGSVELVVENVPIRGQLRLALPTQPDPPVSYQLMVVVTN